MDIDLDDIFWVPVAEPAPVASKFRPNANRPVLRKGFCAPANAKQGTSKSLEPAATVNNVQNVADPVDVHDHEEGVFQSLNSNEIDRQESSLVSQGPTSLSNTSLSIEKDLVILIQDLLEPSSFEENNDLQSETFPGFTVELDQELVTFDEDSLLIGRDSQNDKETIETEAEGEVYPGLATIKSFCDSMATSSIGQHREKFIPKKMNGGSKKTDSGLQHAEAKKDNLPDILADFANEGLTPSSVSGEVFNYSSLMLDESTPGAQVSQTPDSETLKDCSPPSRFDASISIEAEAGVDPGVLGHSNHKNSKRDADVQDSFQEPMKSSNGSAENEVPNSSRSPKRCGIVHHVDESNEDHGDVAQNSDGIAGEANVKAKETLSKMKGPRKSKRTRTKSEKTIKQRKNDDNTVIDPPSDEEETPKKSDGIAGEANVNTTGEETLSKMKKGSKKSKTTSTKREKTVEKRKNDDNTATEQPSDELEPPPKKKKSPHSTQRRKRLDKVLLQTPEEEIDYQKLRMRDLILLAEHKEKLAKKAKMEKPSSGGVSAQKLVDGDDSHNKQSTVSPEENEAELDQPTDNVEPIITLFNYQSFMNKRPTVKWSKEDTELFYEGIRQFGTDLGMIKELFPDLTRHQIKLKYKKEECQNPLRLSEAIHGRAQDHRHFELVIKRLQAANKAGSVSNSDDSVAVPGDGDDEESNGETNNEEAASVPEKEEMKPEETDHANFVTPQDQQEDEEEIDEDFFNSYKTEF